MENLDEVRQKFWEMRAKADAEYEKKVSTRDRQKQMAAHRTKTAVEQAGVSNFFDSLDGTAKQIAPDKIKNRPGEKIALGKTKGRKRPKLNRGLWMMP